MLDHLLWFSRFDVYNFPENSWYFVVMANYDTMETIQVPTKTCARRTFDEVMMISTHAMEIIVETDK